MTTKILTITESEALALTARAVPPDLLKNYAGAALLVPDGPMSRDGATGWVVTRLGAVRGVPTVYLTGDNRSTLEHSSRGDFHVWLPLANPLVQAHLVGWLGRGERGSGAIPSPQQDHTQSITVRDRDDRPIDPTCAYCGKAAQFCGGYLRPRHNRYAWLLPEAHGGLPDWIRLALIAGSVERVAAGMGPLDCVLGQRQQRQAAFGRPKQTVRYRLGQSEHPVVRVDYRGWFVGPEDGDVGDIAGNCDEADLVALAQGYALIDNPAGRVIRFEVPDATP